MGAINFVVVGPSCHPIRRRRRPPKLASYDKYDMGGGTGTTAINQIYTDIILILKCNFLFSSSEQMQVWKNILQSENVLLMIKGKYLLRGRLIIYLCFLFDN